MPGFSRPCIAAPSVRATTPVKASRAASSSGARTTEARGVTPAGHTGAVAAPPPQ